MKNFAVPVLLAVLIVVVIATRPVSVQPVAWAQSGGFDPADAIVSSRIITFATSADSIVIAAGENSRIVMYATGEIIFRGKKISFQADESIRLDVDEQHIAIDGASESEKISIGDDVTNIELGNDSRMLTINALNGIDANSQDGLFNVKAFDFRLESMTNFNVKAGEVRMEAQTDFRMKASNIIQEATMDFRMKGMNIKSEASMSYNIKGLNVTSEAGVNQQVKGTMITVQSTGPNTIKGMPVMIN